jgi:hypothetical protein
MSVSLAIINYVYSYRIIKILKLIRSFFLSDSHHLCSVIASIIYLFNMKEELIKLKTSYDINASIIFHLSQKEMTIAFRKLKRLFMKQKLEMLIVLSMLVKINLS